MTRIAPEPHDPVEVGKRRPWTAVERRIVIERQDGLCDHCSEPLGLIVDLDHIEARWWRGNDHLDNARALHPQCHRKHKTPIDLGLIAHVKRIIARNNGTRRPRKVIAARVDPWPKGRRIQSRPF